MDSKTAKAVDRALLRLELELEAEFKRAKQTLADFKRDFQKHYLGKKSKTKKR